MHYLLYFCVNTEPSKTRYSTNYAPVISISDRNLTGSHNDTCYVLVRLDLEIHGCVKVPTPEDHAGV